MGISASIAKKKENLTESILRGYLLSCCVVCF